MCIPLGNFFIYSNEAKCTGGYPLIIKLNENVEGNVNIIEQEMNPEFIKNVLSKVDYEVLYSTAKQVMPFILFIYSFLPSILKYKINN